MQMDWNAFTPAAALGGGLMIGISAGLMLLVNGRIAGISGMLRPAAGGVAWRLAFLAGLLLAPAAYALVAPLPPLQIASGTPLLVVAGLLVGAGTRFASGCTSGHGVCGLSRWSLPSLVATSCFMAAGFATVFVLRHVLGDVS